MGALGTEGRRAFAVRLFFYVLYEFLAGQAFEGRTEILKNTGPGMLLNFKRFAAISASIVLLSGLCACGPAAQSTHFSGQIGRFCEEGISFTVPMIERSKEVTGEDQFWELRRGIGNTVVIALAPLNAQPNAPHFRSNVALTKINIENPQVDAAEFAKVQIEHMKGELKEVSDLEEGVDETAPWVSFIQVKDGLKVYNKAWFFVEPIKDEQKERAGYVLLGSAIDYNPTPEELKANPSLSNNTLEASLNKFHDIAKTFSFGRFRSGFVKHADILAAVEDKLAPEIASSVQAEVKTEASAASSSK